MSRPSLNDLMTFATVARLRSFRRAAGELGGAHSTLSHALRTLETRLGVRLLNRTTRSVSPTEAGVRLLEGLGPAFDLLDDALESVAPFRGHVQGVVRLNAPRLAVAMFVRDILPKMAERFPEVTVDIVAEDRLVDVVERGFDAGVRPLDMIPKDMIAARMPGGVRYVCVASPAYLERADTPDTPEALHRHRCIGHRLPSGKPYRWEFERNGTPLALAISGRLILDDEALMVDAAIAGLGVAYVSEFAASGALTRGRLRQVLSDWMPGEEKLALYFPGHRSIPPALRALLDVVRDVGASRKPGAAWASARD